MDSVDRVVAQDGLGGTQVSVRELGALYTAWKRADRAGRRRIVAEPLLFLRALSSMTAEPEDDSDPLHKDLTMLAAIALRAGRHVRDGGRFTAKLTKAWSAASETFAALGATIEEMHAGPDDSTAILTLRDAGNGIRAIARALGVSRIAVKRVLAGGSASPPLLERAEKAEPHRDEILALYAECKGNLVRVHEELETRGLVTLSYPALTAFCRKHGIGHEPTKPAGSYAWAHIPGKEMQHDTSPHDAHIGGALRRVQTASLVLCHSHRLFFQFYPRFTRFECKLFLNDGARYHDGTCEHCMVDNSHVIVLSGTGKAMRQNVPVLGRYTPTVSAVDAMTLLACCDVALAAASCPEPTARSPRGPSRRASPPRRANRT
jgi:predicted transcriptional regulator